MRVLVCGDDDDGAGRDRDVRQRAGAEVHPRRRRADGAAEALQAQQARAGHTDPVGELHRETVRAADRRSVGTTASRRRRSRWSRPTPTGPAEPRPGSAPSRAGRSPGWDRRRPSGHRPRTRPRSTAPAQSRSETRPLRRTKDASTGTSCPWRHPIIRPPLVPIYAPYHLPIGISSRTFSKNCEVLKGSRAGPVPEGLK